MKIAVFSDCVLPTLPTGQHGLGRLAWDIANGFKQAGHTVTLYAGLDSIAPKGVALVEYMNETERAQHVELEHDAIIDLSHAHDLSRVHPDWPVINAVADLECRYEPPNTVAFTRYQRNNYARAELVPLGVDVDSIPFTAEPSTPRHVVFCAKIHHFKGFDLALQGAQAAGVPITFAGRNYAGATLPNHIGEIDDNLSLHKFLGDAIGLLAPSRQDAGGRVILEAAACGTPVITMDCTGTQYHVKDGVSGFIVSNPAEIPEAIHDLALLDRAAVRQWVKEHHSIRHMITALERLAERVSKGDRW